MIRRLLFLLVLSAAGALVVRTYVIEAISIATASMEPTLFVGSSYLLNRAVYRLRLPKRGEIVSFPSPLNPKDGMVKRVIAIAGDDIEMRDKKVYLNGELLQEPYTVYKRADQRLEGDTMAPMKVPEGTVFVLGDNRDESFDSSVWKDPKTGDRLYFISVASIRGKVIQVP